MKYLRKYALAFAGLALSAGAASAAPGYTVTALNLRGGPGVQYPVVVSMPPGARVEILECYAGWCEVDWSGYSGYASADYLDYAGYAPPVVRYYQPRTDYYITNRYYHGYGQRYYGRSHSRPAYRRGHHNSHANRGGGHRKSHAGRGGGHHKSHAKRGGGHKSRAHRSRSGGNHKSHARSGGGHHRSHAGHGGGHRSHRSGHHGGGHRGKRH